MTAFFWIRVATVLGFLAVAAGAFGAHGLRTSLKAELAAEAIAAAQEKAGGAAEAEPEPVRRVLASRRLEVFDTGVKYHFWHCLALFGLGLLMLQTGRSGVADRVAGVGFLVGTLIFSGGLYALALTGIPALGMIPVLGGIAFMVGWVGLFLAARPCG